jgi:hypothetical protein
MQLCMAHPAQCREVMRVMGTEAAATAGTEAAAAEGGSAAVVAVGGVAGGAAIGLQTLPQFAPQIVNTLQCGAETTLPAIETGLPALEAEVPELEAAAPRLVETAESIVERSRNVDWEWLASAEYKLGMARAGWLVRMLDLWRDYVSDEDWPDFVRAMEQNADRLFGGTP